MPNVKREKVFMSRIGEGVLRHGLGGLGFRLSEVLQ